MMGVYGPVEVQSVAQQVATHTLLGPLALSWSQKTSGHVESNALWHNSKEYRGIRIPGAGVLSQSL